LVVVVVVVVVVVRTPTPNYLRQASQNLGKYIYRVFCVSGPWYYTSNIHPRPLRRGGGINEDPEGRRD
jgi:hypothetical protein